MARSQHRRIVCAGNAAGNGDVEDVSASFKKWAEKSFIFSDADLRSFHIMAIDHILMQLFWRDAFTKIIKIIFTV